MPLKKSQRSLKNWGKQKWRTSDGKPSKGKKRYLPDKAWKSLTKSEKAATNRAKATFLAVDIFQQIILHLNEEFNVSVCAVTGNESRVKKDWGWSTMIASDNYDYTIFKTLEYLFRDSDINFIDGDPTEIVVEEIVQTIVRGLPLM